MAWGEGYVADETYTLGYYGELNPHRLRLALLNAGIEPPPFETACELGFGQGLCIAVHAAAQGRTQWYGNDFHPQQVSFAQAVTAASGAKALLSDESFAEFCNRDDLPEFDFIGLHGIWAWVSEENRDHILRFISRKLKLGGVLYVSYNVMPGWSPMAPIRKLMFEHANRLSPPAMPSTQKAEAAVDYAKRWFAAGSAYANLVPAAEQRFNGTVASAKRSYVAHEYFNDHWHMEYANDIIERFESVKLSFVCSSNLMDGVDELHLNAEQTKLIDEVDNVALREMLRDFARGTQFRRDVYVKGGRALGLQARREAIGAERVMMTMPRASVPKTFQATVGEMTLSPEIYDPLLDLLSDYQPRSISELEQKLAPKGLSFGQILQATFILSGLSVIASVVPDKVTAASRATAHRFNDAVLRLDPAEAEVPYLASPVTGGAVVVDRVSQHMAKAALAGSGKRAASDLVEVAWQDLVRTGRRLAGPDGTPVGDEAANRTELARRAEVFTAETLPILKALQVF